ncbi:c-type cytochrome [Flaviaesturariibacter terrae]
MHQSRYLFTASFLLLAGWSLFWFSEKISESTRHNGAATATAATPSGKAPAGPTANAPGKPIFAQNCAVCHALNKDLTGPALAGVTGRGPWSDRKKLYAWVHNPSAFMAKDPYTKALQAKYGAVMMAFPQLTEKDIDLVVDYIETAGK